VELSEIVLRGDATRSVPVAPAAAGSAAVSPMIAKQMSRCRRSHLLRIIVSFPDLRVYQGPRLDIGRADVANSYRLLGPYLSGACPLEYRSSQCGQHVSFHLRSLRRATANNASPGEQLRPVRHVHLRVPLPTLAASLLRRPLWRATPAQRERGTLPGDGGGASKRTEPPCVHLPTGAEGFDKMNRLLAGLAGPFGVECGWRQLAELLQAIATACRAPLAH
jgi:hypothetical protein